MIYAAEIPVLQEFQPITALWAVIEYGLDKLADYSIDDILSILDEENITIPRSVALRSDVYEESKTLFGVIFTDCINDLRAYGCPIDGQTVGKMMKEYVMDMTIPDIQCECLCSPTMASAAKSETVMLINKTDLSECLRESQVI